jgi:hypothetical protein
MNYTPYILWGLYTGSNPTAKANYFVSFGLWQKIPTLPKKKSKIFSFIFKKIAKKYLGIKI